MRIKFYLSILILIVSIKSSAQIVTLRGKVTNAQTGEPVPGASILSGSFGTSADDNGSFVFYVQQSVIEESGITASSIGYQTIHFTDITDNYNLTMTPIIQELSTVEISAGAESIVQKAYRLIPDNYLNKDINMIGLERMIHSVKNDYGYKYYYWNNSKIKLYLSAYSNKAHVAQVGLVSKNDNSTANSNTIVRFFDGYIDVFTHDYVYRNARFIKGNADKFTYKLNRKEWLNGTRVYVVNYFSKSANTSAGIMYIDTASYAFVKILRTVFNVKNPPYMDIDKLTANIEYQKLGERWVLGTVMINHTTNFRGYDVERTDQFQVAVSNQLCPEPLPLQAVITKYQLDDSIVPYTGFVSADKKIPNDLKKLAEHTFYKIRMPKELN